MNPEPGLIVGGKYRLERPLGAGGMGAVWVARHTQLEVEVAVKFMAPGLAGTQSAVMRFEREARAAAQLKSPHVVHIYDYGVEDGSPYIAMEMLDGEDLDAMLTREGRLSIPRAAEILGQAAKALRAAHDAGIVHRDLKPSNLFLSRAGGETTVKILDFGIAKETRSGPDRHAATTTGVVLGSPLYMSPEQARGGSVGPPSDLWSLAVVAFEAITGHHPFHGASVGDVIAKICGDELPVASRVAPDLPPAIDAFFERGLARDPARRFESARALADALSALATSAAADSKEIPRAAARRTDAPEPVVALAVTLGESRGRASPAASAPAVEDTDPDTRGRGRVEATAPIAARGDIAGQRTELAPSEPPPRPAGAPASPSAARRIAVLIGLAAIGAAAIGLYLQGARPDPEGAQPVAPRALAASAPVTAAAPIVTPGLTAEAPPPPVESAEAPPVVSASAKIAAPRASQAARAPAASTSARPSKPPVSAPPIDPVFGLPVQK